MEVPQHADSDGRRRRRQRAAAERPAGPPARSSRCRAGATLPRCTIEAEEARPGGNAPHRGVVERYRRHRVPRKTLDSTRALCRAGAGEGAQMNDVSDKPYRVYSAGRRRSVPRPTAGQPRWPAARSPTRRRRASATPDGSRRARRRRRHASRHRAATATAATGARVYREAAGAARRRAAPPNPAPAAACAGGHPPRPGRRPARRGDASGGSRLPRVRRGRRRSNQRIDRDTRAALTPDAGSILTHPTTILVLGVDRAATTGPHRHHHAHALQPQDAHRQPALDPARHAGRDRRQRRDKINAAYFWGGAALGVKTVESSPVCRSTTS